MLEVPVHAYQLRSKVLACIGTTNTMLIPKFILRGVWARVSELSASR